MSRWWEDGWPLVVGGVLVVGVMWLLVVAINGQSKAIDAKCAAMMTLARTTRDSLDVTMACNKMHSDAATANAIAIGAGVVAGSRAGR